MARDTISKSLEFLSADEGEFTNRPLKDDPGGPTKYGVTAATLGAYRKLGRSATAEEVKNLTKQEADRIAVDKYASPIRYDDLPAGIDYMLLNMAYMSGPAQATKLAQELLEVAQDGQMGKITIDALYNVDPVDFIKSYVDRYMKYLKSLKNWKANSRGWTYRITGQDPKGIFKSKPGVLNNAIKMATNRPSVDYKTESMSEYGADAKATPSMVKLTASKLGKIGIGGLLSFGSAAISSTKQEIVNSGLIGKVAWVDDTFIMLGKAGLLLGVAISLYALLNADKRKEAGELV